MNKIGFGIDLAILQNNDIIRDIKLIIIAKLKKIGRNLPSQKF